MVNPPPVLSLPSDANLPYPSHNSFNSITEQTEMSELPKNHTLHPTIDKLRSEEVPGLLMDCSPLFGPQSHLKGGEELLHFMDLLPPSQGHNNQSISESGNMIMSLTPTLRSLHGLDGLPPLDIGKVTSESQFAHDWFSIDDTQGVTAPTKHLDGIRSVPASPAIRTAFEDCFSSNAASIQRPRSATIPDNPSLLALNIFDMDKMKAGDAGRGGEALTAKSAGPTPRSKSKRKRSSLDMSTHQWSGYSDEMEDYNRTDNIEILRAENAKLRSSVKALKHLISRYGLKGVEFNEKDNASVCSISSVSDISSFSSASVRLSEGELNAAMETLAIDDEERISRERNIAKAIAMEEKERDERIRALNELKQESINERKRRVVLAKALSRDEQKRRMSESRPSNAIPTIPLVSNESSAGSGGSTSLTPLSTEAPPLLLSPSDIFDINPPPALMLPSVTVSTGGGGGGGGGGTKRTKSFSTISTINDVSSSCSQTKNGRWLGEEHALFIQGLKQHGRDWDSVAKVVGTRSTVQIRSHAQKYFKKMARLKAVEAQTYGNTSDFVSTSTSQANRRTSAKGSRTPTASSGFMSGITRSRSLSTLSSADFTDADFMDDDLDLDLNLVDGDDFM